MDSDLFNVYPIAWIMKSKTVERFIQESLEEADIIVADFAAGEYDRVPSFFVKIVSELFKDTDTRGRTFVYSIDLHPLRLDSLLGKLEEASLLEYTRVVQSKLEEMDSKAIFRPDMVEYLKKNESLQIRLDEKIMNHHAIPPESFDIGVLNNDVVGYLHEYYKEYSDAAKALQQVKIVLKRGGLLIVTMPCSLYVVDNIAVLEESGFEYVEGIDINLSDQSISKITRESSPDTMSRLNHYSFLVFFRY